MDQVSRLDDIALDLLLGGDPPHSEGARERLRQALAQITAVSTKPPPSDVAAAHLRGMEELARGMAARPPDLAGVLAQVTAFSTKLPASEVTTAHLRAMTELAQGIAAEPASSPVIMATKRPPQERPAAHKRFALALAPALAAPLCIVGIAVAGVSLPPAVRAPFDTLGLGLPNQHPGAVIEKASAHATGCTSGIAALRDPLRVPGDPCEKGAANGRAPVERGHRNAAPREGATPHKGVGRPAGVALAAVGNAGSAASRAVPVVGASAVSAGHGPLGQGEPPVGQPSPPSGGGHPSAPSGGGHSAPHSADGPPRPPSGGGHPGPSHGGGPPPVAHSPAGPVYPGKGCGDKNHVHEREGECSKPPK
jgi:hypothetical protein